MAWNFTSDKPIFKQVLDRILLSVLNGEYPPGSKLPTVRDVAVAAEVNPNTVQRAMTAAEETGLIRTRRGDGHYVTEDEEKIREARFTLAKEEANGFLSSMRALGLSDGEIVSLIESITRKDKNDG